MARDRDEDIRWRAALRALSRATSQEELVTIYDRELAAAREWERELDRLLAGV